MATRIKKGETVRYRGATDSIANKYTVEAFSEDGVFMWLKCIEGRIAASTGRYHTARVEHFEKITPFFEADTIYERTLNDTTGRPGIFIETFTVVRVEKNGSDGRRVAFGRIVGSGYDRWVARFEANYSTQAWRKVG